MVLVFLPGVSWFQTRAMRSDWTNDARYLVVDLGPPFDLQIQRRAQVPGNSVALSGTQTPAWQRICQVIKICIADDQAPAGHFPLGVEPHRMSDLKSKPLIVLKGLLFLLIVVTTAGGLFAMDPGWRTAALILVLIWASARFYYFLFYVLEKYVDPTLKYAGVGDMLMQLLRRRR
jgi:hypothetical protein